MQYASPFLAYNGLMHLRRDRLKKGTTLGVEVGGSAEKFLGAGVVVEEGGILFGGNALRQLCGTSSRDRLQIVYVIWCI